jgi:hypothetical protein
MTDRSEAERVAKGLTKAQKRWLLAAQDIWPEFWFTFPPSNTCRVLHRLELWRWDGRLTPLGLAVRAILQENTDAQ